MFGVSVHVGTGWRIQSPLDSSDRWDKECHRSGRHQAHSNYSYTGFEWLHLYSYEINSIYQVFAFRLHDKYPFVLHSSLNLNELESLKPESYVS